MVSTKERLRFARMFDKQAAAIERQKAAIDRLLSLNVMLSGALFEIAEADPALSGPQARKRAEDALKEASAASAAYDRLKEESGTVPEDDEAPSLSEENPE